MSEPLTLGEMGRRLARHKVLIVLAILVGGLAGLGATFLMPSVYTATATQLVKGIPGTGVAANYEAAQYATSRAAAYPPFIYSLPVLEGVRADLENQQTVAELERELSATNPIGKPLVVISAEGATPEEAQAKANSAARHLARFISQTETIGGKSPVQVETPVQASLPTDPTSPKTVVIIALGALIGFVLAAALALVRSRKRSDSSPRRLDHNVLGGEKLPDADWSWQTEVTAPPPQAQAQPDRAADHDGLSTIGHLEADTDDLPEETTATSPRNSVGPVPEQAEQDRVQTEAAPGQAGLRVQQ